MDSAPGLSRPLAPSRMLVFDFRDAMSHPPFGELYMARLVKFVKLVKHMVLLISCVLIAATRTMTAK